ncbi:MAG TPA: hypothetical protein VIL85_03970 [Thermomicrobiales bacterium]|jgi:hypothetical protein
MSDRSICLFSLDPTYIPSEAAQEEAKALLRDLVPARHPAATRGERIITEVTTQVTAQIDLIHPMENLDRISCHLCGTELDFAWWYDEVAKIYTPETGFTAFEITVPCCVATCSVRDLDYVYPVGFARFQLLALRPGRDLADAEVATFERILGCALRKTYIWL